jgi:hypothetical protein
MELAAGRDGLEYLCKTPEVVLGDFHGEKCYRLRFAKLEKN